jgi:leucyl aminopeptidase (aminopeptidase T)
LNREYQGWCAERKDLPDSLSKQIEGCAALITAVTNDETRTWFRAEVIGCAAKNGLRVLHMPGVDEDLFVASLTGVDLHEIQESGAPLQARLMQATNLEIVTETAQKDEHRLRAVISGRRTHLCGGIALPREIMNLPTGEVYVAPREDQTNGTLVLNGAMGDRVVRFGTDEIILAFRHGRLDLQKSSFSKTAFAEGFERDLKTILQTDPQKGILGEIGIGLNPAVTSLRGAEVWDEKALGTAHIALGANQPFGGTIQVNFHRDLVFYPKAILVDSEPLDIPWSQPKPGRPKSR